MEKDSKTSKPKVSDKNKDDLPIWFNKELDKTEATEEDVKEMDET